MTDETPSGRSFSRVELLGLPQDVLQKVLSSLSGRSMPASLLVCKAFRQCFQHVKFGVDSVFSAKAPASKPVLTFLQENASKLAGVKKAFKQRDTTRFETLVDFLRSMPQEVTAIELGKHMINCNPDLLHGFLSRFPGLKSFHVYFSLNEQIITTLIELPHLTCIELFACPSWKEVERLCAMPAKRSVQMLSKLDLGTVDRSQDYRGAPVQVEFDSDRIVAALQGRRCRKLRDLGLPCAATALQGLSSLTTLQELSSLHLCTWGTGSLQGLTHLAHLLISLRVVVFDWKSMTPTFEALSPLTALTRLTFLSLSCSWGGLVQPSLENLSVLSRLSALKELTINAAIAKFAVGDRLPVQLHVLRWATALERLDLWVHDYEGTWLNMPGDQHAEVRQAIARMSKLTHVKIVFIYCIIKPGWAFYRPMCLFTAAPALRELHFEMDGFPWAPSVAVNTVEEARSCLSCLTQLQSLSIAPSIPAPNCVEFLQGLPSAQLTCLRLTIASVTDLLLQEITRFSKLEELCLATKEMDFGLFDVLKGMTGLSKLLINLPKKAGHFKKTPGGWETSSGREDEEEVKQRTTELKIALKEASSTLGIVPDVWVQYGEYVTGL